MRAAHMVLLVGGIFLWGNSTSLASTDDEVTQTDQTLLEVLEDKHAAIMALPHVVGVGIGKCGAEICIKVMVSECSTEQARQLEALLADYPYSVEKTKPLQTLPSAREP